jgi:DNA-binding CsgD family transcriptional regulator
VERDERPNLHLFLTLVLLAVVAAGVIDLTLDAPRSWLTAHVLVELTLISISLGSAIYLWAGWYRTLRSLRRTQATLSRQREERDRWRESAQRFLEGLGEAIDEQFDAWDLTPTEREVALLLLKGNSHKGIAAITGRSERTVRQHSVAVYRKSGLSGRAELAGFFLGDLLLPSRANGEPEEEPSRSATGP